VGTTNIAQLFKKKLYKKKMAFALSEQVFLLHELGGKKKVFRTQELLTISKKKLIEE